MPVEFTNSYIKDSIDLLHFHKRASDKALAQAPDESLLVILDPESNSIATIVKHIAGNMRSRWRDFLTTDGEKPDRHRDGEFETPPKNRAEMMKMWEDGWRSMFESLEKLTDADVTRTVYVRGEAQSVMQAINRATTHYVYHLGQIVYLAKHFSGANWTTVSVPRKRSA